MAQKFKLFSSNSFLRHVDKKDETLEQLFCAQFVEWAGDYIKAMVKIAGLIFLLLEEKVRRRWVKEANWRVLATWATDFIH